MKRPILFCVLAVLVFGLAGCAESQTHEKAEKAVLQGKISGLEKPVQIMIFYVYNGNSQMDTLTVGTDGKISYATELNESTMASLYQIMPDAADSGDSEARPEPVIPRGINFIFSPGSALSMNADVSDPASFVVKGDEQNRIYHSYSGKSDKMREAYYDIVMKIRSGEDSLSTDELERLQEQRNAMREEMKAVRAEFVKNNPGNYGALYEISINSHRYKDKLDELEQLLSALSPALQEHSHWKAIRSQVTGRRATTPGKLAPVFSRPDMNGDMISLKDFHGQYVVLDFWGSWCGPCRASHPGLIKTYNKYKDEGLEIIGISQEHEDNLEEAKEKWLTAIEEDSIGIWRHVLNNQNSEEMDIVKAYGIVGFPTKFLLDKEGRVIGRYLGGSAEMKKKLEEIFGY